jgi:hypothetical protein
MLLQSMEEREGAWQEKEDSLHEVEKCSGISSTFQSEARFNSMLAEHVHNVPHPFWEISHQTGRGFEQKAWRK